MARLDLGKRDAPAASQGGLTADVGPDQGLGRCRHRAFLCGSTAARRDREEGRGCTEGYPVLGALVKYLARRGP